MNFNSDLELRPLSLDDEKAHADFVSEMMKVDKKIIPSSAEIKEKDGSFKNWLKRKNDESKGVGIPNDRVPATMLFLFRKGDPKILGAVHIRHKLNEKLLLMGGNIGYGVVPSERRKGYADFMLKEALKFCKKLGLKRALITCDKTNIGSAKTIQKNGGFLENELCEDGILKQRYWIEL